MLNKLKYFGYVTMIPLFLTANDHVIGLYEDLVNDMGSSLVEDADKPAIRDLLVSLYHHHKNDRADFDKFLKGKNIFPNDKPVRFTEAIDNAIDNATDAKSVEHAAGLIAKEYGKGNVKTGLLAGLK